jgi:hypothetical protein
VAVLFLLPLLPRQTNRFKNLDCVSLVATSSDKTLLDEHTLRDVLLAAVKSKE